MRKCPHRNVAGVVPPCIGGYDWSACVSDAYEGPLCAACAANHYKNSSLHCVPCGTTRATGITVFATLLGIVLLVTARCYCIVSLDADEIVNVENTAKAKARRKVKAKRKEIQEEKRKRRAILIRLLAKHASRLLDLYNRVAGEKLKIMLTFGQLLVAFTQPEATGTKWPLAFVNFIDGLGALVNFDFFAITRAACTFGTNFLSESLIKASTQLAIIVIGVMAVLYRDRAGKGTMQLRQILVLFTFVIYTGVNKTLCAFFKCVRLEDGALHLSSDLRELCNEGAHASYVYIAAIFVLLFSLGVPCGLVLTLHLAHRSGRLYADADKSATPTPSKEMAFLGDMFKRYERGAYWFEAVHLLFKLWFSGVLVVLGSTEMHADTASDVVGDTRAANVLQLVCAMLALLLYLLISALFQPYVDYGDDVQWLFSLSSLLLCGLVAILQQSNFADKLGASEEALGAILIIFGLLPLLFGFVRLFMASATAGVGCLQRQQKKVGLRRVVPLGGPKSRQKDGDLASAPFETITPKSSHQRLMMARANTVPTFTTMTGPVTLQRQTSIERRQEARKLLTDEEQAQLILSDYRKDANAAAKQLAEERERKKSAFARTRLEKTWLRVLAKHSGVPGVMALSDAERKVHIRALFDVIDVDGDGFVGTHELGLAIELLAGGKKRGAGEKKSNGVALAMIRLMREGDVQHGDGDEGKEDGDRIDFGHFKAVFDRVAHRRQSRVELGAIDAQPMKQYRSVTTMMPKVDEEA